MVSWRTFVLAGGLTCWYIITGPSAEQEKGKEYHLPDYIKVVDTSLPTKMVEMTEIEFGEGHHLDKEKVTLEKVIATSDINFSDDFVIETERYRLVKDNDWLPSRIIGHTAAMFSRLYFWDWDIGWGLDAKESRAVLSMLENNPNTRDVTVRINHNEAIYDCLRLFSDPKVEERNNWLARVLMGIPTSVSGELFAELSRGDYYNPLNQTAVLYSNVESISAHELGHHQDYQRFTSDWEYGLAGAFPPVKLYKEWQASQNALDTIKKEGDEWQFNRYLLPAFLTYLLAGYFMSKRILQKSKLGAQGYSEDGVKKKMKESPPSINPLHTLRHFGTMNLGLYAGIWSYNLSMGAEMPEMLGYAAFAAGLVGSQQLTRQVMKRVLPYDHEGTDYQSPLMRKVKRRMGRRRSPYY